MGSILIRYSKRVASFFSPFLFYFFIFMSLLLSILVIKKCHRIHFKMLKTAIMCFFLMRLAQGNVLQQSDDVYPGDNYADLYPGKAYATSEWIYSKGLKCYAENAFKVNGDVYWSSWGNPDLPVAIRYQFEKPKRVIKMKFEEVYRLPAGSIYEVFASNNYGNCGKKQFQTLLASGTAQQFAAGKEFSNEKSYLCYGVRTYKLNSSWKVVALKRIELRIEAPPNGYLLSKLDELTKEVERLRSDFNTQGSTLEAQGSTINTINTKHLSINSRLTKVEKDVDAQGSTLKVQGSTIDTLSKTDLSINSRLTYVEKADINECDNSPCKNEGTCTNSYGSYSCKCQDGWTGNNCDQDINECDKNTCKNGGTCTNNDGSYSCRCPNLWRGKNCDKEKGA